MIIDDNISLQNKIFHKTYNYRPEYGKQIDQFKNVTIEGDDKFKARVASDLKTLMAIPAGRKLLGTLESAKNPIKITPLNSNVKNSSLNFSQSVNTCVGSDGTPSKGEKANVRYNPAFINKDVASKGATPPLINLYHELAHAYNVTTGTVLSGVITTFRDKNNKVREEEAMEHQAIGLPLENLKTHFTAYNNNVPHYISNDLHQAPIAHPGEKHRTLDNPVEYTENGLRKALNRQLRESYIEYE